MSNAVKLGSVAVNSLASSLPLRLGVADDRPLPSGLDGRSRDVQCGRAGAVLRQFFFCPRPCEDARRHKTAWAVVALLVLSALAARETWAQPSRKDSTPLVLTKVAQIRSLSAEQAKQKLPIHLAGTITYHAPEYVVTFFQDQTAGIFVWPEHSDAGISVGSFVEISGNTTPGDFAPSIEHAQIHVLGNAPLPAAAPKTLDTLLTGSADSQWVQTVGIVHSVSLEDRLPPDMRRGPPQLVLGIASGYGRFKARIRNFRNDGDYGYLVDSSIVIRGACGTLFNDRRQLLGVQLFVPDIEQVTVEQQASAEPPQLPIKSLMRFTPAQAAGHRMRIQGVVTLSKPGSWIFVQDASGGVQLESTQATAAEPGDLVDAIGFPMAGRYAPILQDGSFRVRGKRPLPKPVYLASGLSLSGDHDAELVSIDGRLLDQSERGEYRVLTLRHANFTFIVQIGNKAVTSQIRSIRNGSLLRATGVWSVETDDYRRPIAYRVLLHTADNIIILEQTSWWTVQRFVMISGILAGVILLGALWVAALRRRVRAQTETLRATLESTADGILVVNSEGKADTYNHKFVQMWRIPESLLRSNREGTIFESLTARLKDRDGLDSKVWEPCADCQFEGDDVLESKDGRFFERHSEPQFVRGTEVGRVWGFRDVTERRRAQERLAARTAELDSANLEIRRLNEQLTAENNRMSAELEVTRRLQQMILPRDEDLRHVPDLDISGFMEPASEVGGDYYDVVSKGGRVVVSIGDVTGHGLESGVMAIMVQTAVRTLLASGHYEKHRFFEVLNRVVYDNAHRMNSDRNLTLSLLDYQDRVATISGQHEEVIVVRKDGALERHDTIDLGFPLGLEEHISSLIAETRVPLESGDVMVLYTDGITEATCCTGVSYGIERLAQAVKDSHEKPAAGIREAVLGHLREHVNGTGLLDDITLVVIKVL